MASGGPFTNHIWHARDVESSLILGIGVSVASWLSFARIVGRHEIKRRDVKTSIIHGNIFLRELDKKEKVVVDSSRLVLHVV